MIEWWLSSFFKDKCGSGKDGRKPFGDYLEELEECCTKAKDDIIDNQKIKKDLEYVVKTYVECARSRGVVINAYDVIKNVTVPNITDLRMSGDLYFKFKGFDCSVVPDGRLFVY